MTDNRHGILQERTSGVPRVYLPLHIPVERHLANEASHGSSEGESDREVRNARQFCTATSHVLDRPQISTAAAEAQSMEAATTAAKKRLWFMTRPFFCTSP